LLQNFASLNLNKQSVGLSAFGAMYGSLMTGARVFYAGGRDRLTPFPDFLSDISKDFRTPYAALLVEGGFACAITFFGKFQSLVNYFGFASWIFYALCAVSLIWIRKKRPDITQPFKVKPFPALPIVFICCALSICLSALIQEPVPTLLATLMDQSLRWRS